MEVNTGADGGVRNDAAKPASSAARDIRGAGKRERPLRIVAALGWVAVGAASGGMAFAACWPARLDETGTVWVAVSWVAFMIETFAMHAGVAIAAVVGFALLTRRWRMALAALLLSLWCGWGVIGTLAGQRVRAVTAGTEIEEPAALRVLSMNVLYSRADVDRVMAVIERERPDVLLIQEWTDAAETRYGQRLRAMFPHAMVWAQNDAFGQASFSTLEMRDERAYLSPRIMNPQQSFVVEHAGAAVRVVNVHLLPPVSIGYFRLQRSETAALAEFARERLGEGERLVLAGDFNATWASAHGRALRDAGLGSAHEVAGVGLGGTWPMNAGPLARLGAIGLDQVLVGGGLGVRSVRVLENIGSDHAPVLAELTVRTVSRSK